MAHVFISYAHEDGDFGDVLINKLKEEGINHWVDKHIRAGQEWRQAIDDAIRASFALIVVMSPAAKTSEYVTYEWAFAVGARIPVIPLLYRSTPLHPRLEALQHLDFSSRTARPWDNLIELLNLLESGYIPLVQSNLQADIAIAKPIEDLSSDSVQKRRKAIKALSNIRDRNTVPDLIKVIQTDSSRSARKEAVEALVKIGDISTSRSLIVALYSDPSIVVRSAAAWALGEFRSKEAVESLIQVVENWERGQEQTKVAAVEALRKIGEKSIVPRLLEVMDTIDQELCAKIIETLGYLGETTAVERIAKYLDSKSNVYSTKKTQQIAAEALERIGTPEALATVEKWKQEERANAFVSSVQELQESLSTFSKSKRKKP